MPTLSAKAFVKSWSSWTLTDSSRCASCLQKLGVLHLNELLNLIPACRHSLIPAAQRETTAHAPQSPAAHAPENQAAHDPPITARQDSTQAPHAPRADASHKQHCQRSVALQICEWDESPSDMLTNLIVNTKK